jgi:hypothetical protein
MKMLCAVFSSSKLKTMPDIIGKGKEKICISDAYMDYIIISYYY